MDKPLSHTAAGAWPLTGGSFWWQVMIIPISQASRAYAEDVRRSVRAARFFVDCDHGDNKMEKKVRDAQLEQYNYILVSVPRRTKFRQRVQGSLAVVTLLGRAERCKMEAWPHV